MVAKNELSNVGQAMLKISALAGCPARLECFPDGMWAVHWSTYNSRLILWEKPEEAVWFMLDYLESREQRQGTAEPSP